jgi:hypothetical protein
MPLGSVSLFLFKSISAVPAAELDRFIGLGDATRNREANMTVEVGSIDAAFVFCIFKGLR